jgi:hypothetical protein
MESPRRPMTVKFHKLAGNVYEWFGLEAYGLIFGFPDEVVNNNTISLDFFAYDLNEPDMVG